MVKSLPQPEEFSEFSQLSFDFFSSNPVRTPLEISPDIINDWAPIKPTKVFNTYWYFAAERQNIFFRRLKGYPSPWTEDQILERYKFTNTYRASDRVSQYLIRNVIYRGDDCPREVFFRTLLFKMFNRIETWELLEQNFEVISYSNFSFDHYDAVLHNALQNGKRIFSAAYIMPSGTSSFGHPKKHQNLLRLLEQMMNEEVPSKIVNMRSMRQVFELLSSYPMIGDFLAYQYAIDINYGTLTNFTEMEFVIPGPGAKDGIHKCFESLGGLNEMDVIRLMAERQEIEFARLGIKFQSLWGRTLQLIDCQNLFCEVDKYARLAHPEITGISGRTQIKQVYKSSASPINYWYPPKWGLNERIRKELNGE